MTDNTSPEPQDDALLTDIEARVLGSLMEKQLTTPDVYPLTLNSLVTACNQKTSREPVMNLTKGEVQGTINHLQDRDLVQIEYGSRADKYDQRLTRSLHFDKAEQAIFSLLLLRGPQTLNELFSRSKRMVDFSNTQEITDLIERQLAKLKPLLMVVPAQAGQREDRYMHLLCGEPDLSTLVTKRETSSAGSSAAMSDLEARVAQLEEQVATLMAQLSSND